MLRHDGLHTLCEVRCSKPDKLNSHRKHLIERLIPLVKVAGGLFHCVVRHIPMRLNCGKHSRCRKSFSHPKQWISASETSLSPSSCYNMKVFRSLPFLKLPYIKSKRLCSYCLSVYTPKALLLLLAQLSDSKFSQSLSIRYTLYSLIYLDLLYCLKYAATQENCHSG